MRFIDGRPLKENTIMKKFLYLIFVLLSDLTYAQVKNGDRVPDLNFETVLNAPVQATRLSKLRGKVVLIDFWATWCGSCLEAMPHLKALQAKYPKQLQVISVNDETVKRTGLYLKSKPSNLWFAVDTGRAIAAVFPHQLIPHTIVIDQDGKLVAAASPAAITAKVIDSLLAKKEVHLAEKKDNLLSYEDLIKQNFFAADTVQNRFMMQGEIKGGPGLSTIHLDDKIFNGRRITCINLPITTLYMIAYGNFPYGRMIDQTKNGQKVPVYCLDLIVKNKEDLMPALKTELARRFDLQAKIEPVLKEVRVLKITDAEKFKTLARNHSGSRTYYSRHGEIDQQSMTMKDFAGFLENYGINKLVVDETGNNEKLDIKFTFQPENPQSLFDILYGMGLTLTKEQRKIDILVLYKL